MDKPKVKLTQEAQDMIDMFSELDEEQCNGLAKLLNTKGVAFAIKFKENMQEWVDAKPSED